jgi:hypothetical protein
MCVARITCHPLPAAVAVFLSAVGLSAVGVARTADLDRNTTGLPSYPHLRSAVMDPVARNTQGRQCTHFAADSPDSLEAVESWYRQALPGAVESDVNKDSIYGSYFKLNGIRLVRGNDFLTVYRLANGSVTSIELFNCGPAR